MTAEAQKLEVVYELTSLETKIARDHRLHLIEQKLVRNTPKEGKRFFQPADQGTQILPWVEAQPEQARIAEHDQQRVAHGPGEEEAREIDLSQVARRRFETQHRLCDGAGSFLAHELGQPRVPTRVACGLDLCEEPPAREFGIGLQPRPQDRFVRFQLAEDGRTEASSELLHQDPDPTGRSESSGRSCVGSDQTSSPEPFCSSLARGNDGATLGSPFRSSTPPPLEGEA
jgi:hypothetical protein